MNQADLLYVALALAFFLGWLLQFIFWIDAERRWRKYQKCYFQALHSLPEDRRFQQFLLTDFAEHLAQRRSRSRWG